MNELPDGWSEVALAEVAEVTLGQSPPGSSYNEDGEGTPFLQGKKEFGEMYPEIAKWTTEPKKFASAGDILLSIRAPVGPTNIAPMDCAIGRGLHAIRPTGTIDRDYLLWGLRSTAHVLASQATGSTFEAVSGKQVKEHRLALAPLAEQQRMVAAIEELFTRLDVIEPALEGLLERLGLLRSAILADTFHANRDLPDGWEETMLSEIGKWGSGGTPKRTNDAFYENGTIPWVIIGDLDDSVVIETATLITEEALAQSSAKLVPQGAVLIAMYGSIGKLGITGRELATNQAIAFCVAHEGIDTRFLFWYLMSQRPYLAGAGKGATQKNISQTVLKTWPIRIAPLLEQQRIVGYLEAAFSRMDALEVTVRGLLERVGVFRQSVLAEAFAGRLVPQDPSDEPASALLERIRTDREAGPKKRGKVKA